MSSGPMLLHGPRLCKESPERLRSDRRGGEVCLGVPLRRHSRVGVARTGDDHNPLEKRVLAAANQACLQRPPTLKRSRVGERERKREREKEREKERERESKREREREREREKERGRKRERERERERERKREKERERQTDRERDRERQRETEKERERERKRKRERERGRGSQVPGAAVVHKRCESASGQLTRASFNTGEILPNKDTEVRLLSVVGKGHGGHDAHVSDGDEAFPG